MGDPDPVPAVAALVRDDADRVLAVRDRARDAWTLPLGHLEPGESVREAVRREVREEADVDVTVDRLAGVYSDPETQVVETPSGTVQFVTTLVVCTHEGGTPEGDGEETTDARFFDPGALPEMGPLDRWIEDALAGPDPVLG